MNKKVTDDLGRVIYLNKPPRRIVSLCPSLTETLFALGLDELVIGRTDYCVHPEEKIDRVQSVGGPKSVSLPAVESLMPDLVLAVKEENNKKTLESLSSLYYKCFIFDINCVDGALKMIEKLGEIFEIKERAAAMRASIKNGFELVGRAQGNPSFLYMTWSSPYIAAGTGNYINSLLSGFGFNNCLSGSFRRYVRMDLNALKLLKADIIFLPSEPYNYTITDKIKFEKFFPEARVILVDGEMFCWYGSRMEIAGKYLKDLFKKFGLIN
ncbi:MAG TPA: helical backbone metal receptor [Candidatus Wallbacteria bacterium]|nr:helical backbone metal receptor [Candidatus Wallbacteria bacterium]HPG58580.1 helical backbone metal receptor [Candidatus Wallbacteria bacterium]